MSAILFADMVGYSFFKERVAHQLGQVLLEIANDRLRLHDGRLAKTLGDGFLAEFPTATGAFSFAEEFQRAIAERNEKVDADQRFRMRVGLHFGDIIVEASEISGRTVVVAARAEPLATPGGICMTEPVWQQIREQLPRPAKRLGPLRVKGIGEKLVFYHLYPLDSTWAGRTRHRFRLALSGPWKVAAAFLLAGLMAAAPFALQPLWTRLVPMNGSELIAAGQRLLEHFDEDDNLEKAINYLSEAVAAGRPDENALAWLGMARWRRYQESGDVQDRTAAWNCASNALAINQDTAQACFVAGLVARDRGAADDLRVATNYLSRANVLANWQNLSVLIALASACLSLGDTTNSNTYIESVRRGLKMPGASQTRWYVFNSLGEDCLQQGDFQGAVSNFKLATIASKKSPLAWCNLGNSYLLLPDGGHEQEALRCLEQSRRFRPTAHYFHSKGEFLRAKEFWEESADNFCEAARLRPADYRYQGDAGLARVQAGWFLKRDLIDPDGFAARLARGRDGLDIYLRGRLGETTWTRVQTLGSRRVDAALAAALAHDLNAVVWGENIYDAARFERIALGAEVRERASKSLAGGELRSQNRRLLEDAYPKQIARIDSRRMAEAGEYLTNALVRAQSVLQDRKNCLVTAHIGLYLAVLNRVAEARLKLQEAMSVCAKDGQVRDVDRAASLIMDDTKEIERLNQLEQGLDMRKAK
jgi:class 3 adenylate cyclase/tetratricopeptide (TPR) repeat protein